VKNVTHNRRCFLLAAPFAWLCGFWRRSPAAAATLHVDRQGMPLSEWLRRERSSLPALIHDLANMERRGVQSEDPDTWYRLNYVGAIPWRPGVVMLFAFGRQSEAQASFEHALTWLDEANVSTIADAWSDDRRVWARFVLAADREALAPLITKTIAPLSSRFGSKTHEC
jgi:hypothetical protein